MNKAIAPLPLILLSLLLAIWGGWIRIGWSLPVSQVAAQHGAMMVGSFLGTLIFLERAVTFQNKWVLLLPVINGLSVLAFVVHQPELAQLFLIAGSLGFTVMCGYFIKQYKELYYYVFFAGALCLLTGNIIIWKTNFYPNAVTWWIGFLLLKLPLKIYRPVMYVWFGLLQFSLVLRVVADAVVDVSLRRAAGMLNGIAILLFFITIAITVKIELMKWRKNMIKGGEQVKRGMLNIKGVARSG